MTHPSAWKLGLFVVCGFLALAASLSWLAAERLNPQVLAATTYFNESVEGLDLGAPIKIRGVKVGVVQEIGIAPDHRMVEVRLKLFINKLEGLGLWPLPPEAQGIMGRLGPRDLRVQLSSSGITGIKFIEADFFDPTAHPLPELAFAAGENYLPSVPSTLKNLGDALSALAERLPETLVSLEGLLLDLRNVLREARVGELAENMDGVLKQLQEQLQGLDSVSLSQEYVTLADRGSTVITEVESALRRLAGENGELTLALRSWLGLAQEAQGALLAANLGETASQARLAAGQLGSAANALEDFGGQAAESSSRLDSLLLSLEETSRSLRQLTDLLERDPAALVRGRRAVSPHPFEDKQ